MSRPPSECLATSRTTCTRSRSHCSSLRVVTGKIATSQSSHLYPYCTPPRTSRGGIETCKKKGALANRESAFPYLSEVRVANLHSDVELEVGLERRRDLELTRGIRLVEDLRMARGAVLRRIRASSVEIARARLEADVRAAFTVRARKAVRRISSGPRLGGSAEARIQDVREC